LRSEKTVFVRYGDLIGLAAGMLSLLFLIVLPFHRKFRNLLPQ
jgi:hypothetical protein